MNQNYFQKDEYKDLNKRIGQLSKGIAVIKVGASSEVENVELMERIDDALCATRAAMTHGVLPGGGSALFSASLALDSRDEGAAIIK